MASPRSVSWEDAGILTPVLPPWSPALLCPQVLLVQFKGTGKYYAIKALKKQEVLSRDEIERCVVIPRAPGPAAGSRRLAWAVGTGGQPDTPGL